MVRALVYSAGLLLILALLYRASPAVAALYVAFWCWSVVFKGKEG